MKRLNQNWKRKLTPQQYRILKEKGTEPPFSGKLLHNKEKGTYQCAGCGNNLFTSDAKFDSGSGWPSFSEAVAGSVVLNEDLSLGMKRVEVACAKCKGHLGHIFDDGPKPSRKRYCINSGAMEFGKEC